MKRNGIFFWSGAALFLAACLLMTQVVTNQYPFFAAYVILQFMVLAVAWSILGGYAGMDLDLLPLAFVVVIIGGMGSLKGALVGSIAVGLIDNFGKALVPELSYFTLFAPMVIMLAIKPTGLYGRG